MPPATDVPDTHLLPNLEVYSTWQAESINAVVGKSLSHQISLLKACRQLVKEVRTFEAKLLVEKINSIITRPQILDFNRFTTLLDKNTNYTINFIASEWAVTCILRPDSIWQGSCLYECTFSERYGLPCYY